MGCEKLQLNNFFSFIDTEENPQNGLRFVGNDNAESVFPVRQNKFKFINEEFTGEQFDLNLQMQYLRAIYYDQSNGRFNRLDPFSGNNYDPQSLHKYAYTHCNPVMGIDPSGEFNLANVLIEMTIIATSVLYMGFGTSYSSSSKLKGNDRELAYLANDVYNTTGAPNGWTRLNHADIIDTFYGGINTLSSGANPKGLFIAIYKKNKTISYMLAFRGTEPDSWYDWAADIIQGTGLATTQYRKAIDVAQNISQTANKQGLDLTFTGHSLVGGLASAASLVTGRNAVIFNPARVHSNTLKPYGANFAAADSLITRYIVSGEILDSLQNNNFSGLGAIMPDSVGKRINLYPNSSFMDPLRGHTMGTVLNLR